MPNLDLERDRISKFRLALKGIWSRITATKKRRYALAFFSICFIAYLFCLPKRLFNDPLCYVLDDRNGQLLGARIASDGQWRFPAVDTLPEKFISALVLFEDKRFFSHPGVDPISLARAFRQNIQAKSVVSGGSTLTMQVIRLSRKGKSRSIGEKLVEMVLATRLELRHSKRKILSLYAANAPFGGNVVGLEAASWRYFAKEPHLLSWAEAATLAVLPNSPALIHPGRNRNTLLSKRNRLLDRLRDQGKIDDLTCELAKEEPLPEAPHPLPQFAPHLLDRLALQNKKTKQFRFHTTLDNRLQQQVLTVMDRHHHRLAANGVHNMAVLVVAVETGDVLVYQGNAPGAGAAHGEAVDIIQAPRSTGSILKPFLYAGALDEGLKLPASLVPDIPTQMRGYRPENFNERFDGLVPARTALARSLNVPFVRLLQEYGLEKFHHRLRQLGLRTITKAPSHYGLSLILGGAETNLWDLAGAYASMSRCLNHFQPLDSRYEPGDWRPAQYLISPANKRASIRKEPEIFSAGAIYQTFDAMQYLERPDQSGEWERFQSSRRIAWKTGTSFGFRDAWTIGVTPEYVIAVWAGNADGEGRPGLIGVQSAAPILFELYDLLPATTWWRAPLDEMQEIPVCQLSGYRALPACPVDTVWGTRLSGRADACPYHRELNLDPSGQWQVNSNCESPARMLRKTYFILPPVEEYYYRSRHPGYEAPPPFLPGCSDVNAANNPMQMIYPRQFAVIKVPVDLDGSPGATVFQVAHRDPETTIYWNLDAAYIGSTQTFHQMELRPAPGPHRIVLVDEYGNRLEQSFEVALK